jgi:hypothetical protein
VPEAGATGSNGPRTWLTPAAPLGASPKPSHTPPHLGPSATTVHQRRWRVPVLARPYSSGSPLMPAVPCRRDWGTGPLDPGCTCPAEPPPELGPVPPDKSPRPWGSTPPRPGPSDCTTPSRQPGRYPPHGAAYTCGPYSSLGARVCSGPHGVRSGTPGAEAVSDASVVWARSPRSPSSASTAPRVCCTWEPSLRHHAISRRGGFAPFERFARSTGFKLGAVLFPLCRHLPSPPLQLLLTQHSILMTCPVFGVHYSAYLVGLEGRWAKNPSMHEARSRR